MYQFQVISDGYVIFTTHKYISFVELVNNTDFDFDYIDSKGYEVYLFNDNKLLNIFCSRVKSFKEINS